MIDFTVTATFSDVARNRPLGGQVADVMAAELEKAGRARVVRKRITAPESLLANHSSVRKLARTMEADTLITGKVYEHRGIKRTIVVQVRQLRADDGEVVSVMEKQVVPSGDQPSVAALMLVVRALSADVNNAGVIR